MYYIKDLIIFEALLKTSSTKYIKIEYQEHIDDDELELMKVSDDPKQQ